VKIAIIQNRIKIKIEKENKIEKRKRTLHCI
jgi:hypothetical protein